MKFTKLANGKVELVLNRQEWEKIGQQRGWIGSSASALTFRIRTSQSLPDLTRVRFQLDRLLDPAKDRAHMDELQAKNPDINGRGALTDRSFCILRSERAKLLVSRLNNIISSVPSGGLNVIATQLRDLLADGLGDWSSLAFSNDLSAKDRMIQAYTNHLDGHLDEIRSLAQQFYRAARDYTRTPRDMGPHTSFSDSEFSEPVSEYARDTRTPLDMGPHSSAHVVVKTARRVIAKKKPGCQCFGGSCGCDGGCVCRQAKGSCFQCKSDTKASVNLKQLADDIKARADKLGKKFSSAVPKGK